MKLGRLLLRRLSRKPSAKKKRARAASARAFKPVSKFKRAPRPSVAPGLNPSLLPAVIPKARALNGTVSTAPEPVVLAAIPTALPAPSVNTVHPGDARASGGPGPLSAENLARPNEKLRDSIEAFLLDQRSNNTRRAYGKDLKRFVQFLLVRLGHERGGAHGREHAFELIDRRTIIAYKEQLATEGLEHTSIDRHLATLRSFFRWLVDDGVIATSPAEGVRFLNPKRVSSTRGFTDEEVRRVLERPDIHSRTGALHNAVLMMLFYCGLRRAELCDARTTQVTEERGHHVLKIRGKGNSERMVVIPPPVWKAIRHYMRITNRTFANDEPLFMPLRNNRTSEFKKPLDGSAIFYMVTRYAKLAGITARVSPHSCRATAISNARDHDVPDRAIQEFAGWASPDMITRYDKRKSSVEKSAAHAIDYGNPEDRVTVDEAKAERIRAQFEKT